MEDNPSTDAIPPPVTTTTATVISESANVVVQRLTNGSPTWNLTATDGEAEAEGEVMGYTFPDLTPLLRPTDPPHCIDVYNGMAKDNPTLFSLPNTSSLLTQAQIHQMGQVLSAVDEPPKTEPQDSLTPSEVTTPSSRNETPESGDIASKSPDSSVSPEPNATDDSLNASNQLDSQFLMTESSDSLKLDIPGVLDLSGESLETRQLLEDVINSELLTIKNVCLGGQVAATAVVTTSEGETSAGEMRAKGRSGRKKQEATEKAMPLRRSVRHKKTAEVEAAVVVKQEVKKDGEDISANKKDSAAEPKVEESKKKPKKSTDAKVVKEAAVRSKRTTMLRAEKVKYAKFEEDDSEEGDNCKAAASLKRFKDRQGVRSKRPYRKRKTSGDSDEEMSNQPQEETTTGKEAKKLKELSQEEAQTPKRGSRDAKMSRGESQESKTSSKGESQDIEEEGEIKLKEDQRKAGTPSTRRRSEDATHPLRSDHTYERRRLESSSDTAPSLFTPDNAVFIKLGTPKEGEGERECRSHRTMEMRRRDRAKSWSEPGMKDREEGELSSDNDVNNDNNNNDSDWTSDDDPERLWCICRKPHDNRFMICCDRCEEWFHGSCVDITKAEGKRLDREKIQWICPVCDTKEKREARQEMKSSTDESNKPCEDQPIDTTSESASQLTPDRSVGATSQGSQVTDSEDKGGLTSPELPQSTKKKRLKFYKPPPPKQRCIGPGCQGWSVPGAIYCSNDCIVRHARQSIRIIHQEKEKSMGTKWRRDSAGSTGNRNVMSPNQRHEPERIPVLERHTGKVRTGLSAPIQDQVYDFLERHPSYEVLKPGSHHGAFYSASKSKPAKSKKEEQIDSRVRERDREHQRERQRERQRDQAKSDQPKSDPKPKSEAKPKSDAKPKSEAKPKSDAKPHTHRDQSGERSRDRGTPVKETKAPGSKTPVKDKMQQVKEKTAAKERTPTKEQQDKSRKAEEHAKESVRRNVRESLRDMLAKRVKGAKDLLEYEDQVKKKAYVIEYELYRLYSDTGSKYKSRYRSLFFNIKDSKNQGLFRRILKGEISASKLVRMSSDQLASKQLAEWREREAKHTLEMIVQEEEERKILPVTKKTHKGEVEINDDNLSSLESNLHDKPEPKHHIDIKIIENNASSLSTLDVMLGDTTLQHRTHLFDLNCKICTGKMAPPREETAVAVAAPSRRTKAAAPSVEDEEEEEERGEEEMHAGSSSSSASAGEGGVAMETEEIRGNVEEDVKPFDEMDDLPSPEVSPIEPSPQDDPVPARQPPPPLWKGSIYMEEVSKFVMAGFHVSGPIRTISMDMPDNITICGRIPYPVVWDYFKQLRKANTTDLIIVRFHVVNEGDKLAYITLFQYFHSRQRIGVVGNNKKHIKDMYVLPLSAHEPVPKEIMPFQGPGLAEPRPHMLLGLLVRHRERARSASLGQAAPRHQGVSQPPSTAGQHRQQPPQQKRRLSETEESLAPHSPTDPKGSPKKPEDDHEVKRFRPSKPAIFIPDKQHVDPIVAQYANADPVELTDEPYSPTQEDIEAPYDPSDIMDVIGDASKVKGQMSGGGEPAKESAEPGQSPSRIGEFIQEKNQKLCSSEIAEAASDVTANLLTAFSAKPDLTEQQQLLIKLTQQVEDAKKALLDRQIASLQSEIDRATSDSSDYSPGQPVASVKAALEDPTNLVTALDELGSPQIRKAPADSSTAVVDDPGGGTTPTKDEPQTKDSISKTQQPTNRSALDFIQSKLFEPKFIHSVATKVAMPTPPPINRTPISEPDPNPPFEGTYDPEYTAPSIVPTYNPTSYGYDNPQGAASAPYGDPSYNQGEEYRPMALPEWGASRNYAPGNVDAGSGSYPPGAGGMHNEPFVQEDGYRQQNFNQQPYGPADYARGQWGQRGGHDPSGYRGDQEHNRDVDYRFESRDYGHGFSRY